MVGHLGTQQLGAVSLGAMSVSFSYFLFSFLLFLTTPRVAAAWVAGDKARLSKQAAMGIWLAAGLGVGMALFMYFSAPAIVAGERPVMSQNREPQRQQSRETCRFIVGMSQHHQP